MIGAEFLGANRKVNNLVRLTREAKHEVLALSDGDVRVGPNYLRNVVAPLRDKMSEPVTSFYRGIAQMIFMPNSKPSEPRAIFLPAS